MSIRALRVKKKIEEHFLDRARKFGLQIPAGEMVDSESPDFLIRTNRGTLGIEVTQLFQPATAGGPGPRATESFQDKVVRVAAELYQKSGARPVDVLVYWDGKKEQVDYNLTAKALVDFVQCRYSDSGDDIETYYRPDVPEGFLVIRVARPIDGTTNRWQPGHSGQTLLLEHARLSAEIERKNKWVPNYREKASCVWLLVVASLFPLSASFSIPNEIETWKFRSDFDRVLLLSEQDSRVFELHDP